MATVTNNVLIDGMSGKFGGSLVFRTMRGKTFVSALARKPNKKKETEAQRNNRVTFRKATQWAQITLRDPEKKIYYQQRAKVLKLPNAYTAAITDYMRKPKVVKTQHQDSVMYTIRKPGFELKDVWVSNETTPAPVNVVIRKDKAQWFIHFKRDADPCLKSFTLVIRDSTLHETEFADALI